jgi:hypothetical protein
MDEQRPSRRDDGFVVGEIMTVRMTQDQYRLFRQNASFKPTFWCAILILSGRWDARNIPRALTDATLKGARMADRKDITVRPGAVFGRLTVIAKSARKDGKNTFWDCLCLCGGSNTVTTTRLRSGHTSSCGCWGHECEIAHADSMRQPFPRERRIWYGMVARCTNPDNSAYKWYGARGITVCKRWQESFEAFMEDMGPSNGLEIDRIENDGPYCSNNCRWTTRLINSNNRRSNVFVEHNGKALTHAQWARIGGIKYGTFRSRIVKSGWDISRALTEAVRIGGAR